MKRCLARGSMLIVMMLAWLALDAQAFLAKVPSPEEPEQFLNSKVEPIRFPRVEKVKLFKPSDNQAGFTAFEGVTDVQVPQDWAKGTLRFTTGRMTTEDDIDQAAAAVVRAAKKLQ